MSKSPSHETFVLLSQAALREWRNDDEEDFADWFEKIYVDADWCGWYLNATKTFGIGKTNNVLESYNKTIKTYVCIYACMYACMYVCMCVCIYAFMNK
jgi:hypothetical protein